MTAQWYLAFILMLLIKFMGGLVVVKKPYFKWRSQTFPDGRAHNFYKILSIIYKHAGSYVHLLKGVVCMKMHTNYS